jgi:hypothetical protein
MNGRGGLIVSDTDETLRDDRFDGRSQEPGASDEEVARILKRW